VLDDLRPALEAATGPLVLTAPTGSGKSTRVPLWLPRPVLVVEPRRVACRSLARYMGAGVGYAVRFESHYGPDTEVLLVTPGVALGMAVAGDLTKYASVVLDEFHERGLETDLLLALLPRVHPRARLVVMSATLAVPRLVQHLGAGLLKAEGRQFPVELEYRGEVLLPTRERLPERVRRAAEEALARTEGHVLVFLPGMRQISECARALARLPVDVVPLHGSLPNEAQDRAFQDSARRRIVLATNVAETSVTLPGITAVVDSGLARQVIHRAGHSALALQPISLASAEQRRGRAGRLGPGICFRLWSREARLEATTAPELQRQELTAVALWAASAGHPLEELAFLDPPPAHAVARARERLLSWGALAHDPGSPSDGQPLGRSEFRITASGRELNAIPLPPQLARLLQAAPPDLTADVADLCAVLEARTSLLERQVSEEVRDARAQDLPGSEPVQAILALRRGDVKRHGLHPESLRTARDTARQLGGMGESAVKVRELTEFLLRTWPERAYVRRARRDAFGNGTDEVRLKGAEDSLQAAVMLVVEPVASERGLGAELRARYPLPCTLRQVLEAGLGVARVDQPVLEGDRVVAEVATEYAGRELGRTRCELSGALLCQGVAELILRGKLFPSVRAGLAERLQQRALDAALEGSSQDGEPRAWLERRLEDLGVREPEDHLMLSADDLLPAPLEDSRARFLEANYPSAFSSGSARYRVEYLPGQRQVVLHWESGIKNAVVSEGRLPRWNGWQVWLDERGRRTLVRS